MEETSKLANVKKFFAEEYLILEAVLMVICIILGILCFQENNIVKTVEQQKAELVSHYEEIQTENKDLEEKVTSCNEQIKILGKNEKQDELNNNINNLEETVKNFTSQKQSLETEVSNLQNQKSQLENEINALEAEKQSLNNEIAKLKDNGRMAIIQNGSSLSNGDAGSGSSEIRRYIIENDWLDAIVQLPNDSFYNTGIATYIWLVTKEKPVSHREYVQLIDASKCLVPRRKPIGNKRVDITQEARNLIVKAYGEYRDDTFEATAEGGHKLVVKSKILPALSLGYNKITVENPLLDPDGKPILKKGKPQPDSSKRDTENVPLDEDMDEYFEREVIPYSPNAWIDHSKDKVGYEIPFTRTFYEYKVLEPAADIAARIEEHEKVLMEKLQALFGKAES